MSNPMTKREALSAMGYSERKAGHWLKPIGFQCFSYHEGKNKWTCWFKAATGEISVWESKTFDDAEKHGGSYLEQLKTFECYTRTGMNPCNWSDFELGVFGVEC